RLGTLKGQIECAELCFAVVESIPVHEDIKLGRPARDRLIEHYCTSVRSMGELGVPVLCYNFMPVFDWTRTDLAHRLPDGSTALAYDDRALAAIDLSRGTGELPGWAAAYGAGELQALLAAYRPVDAERRWDNLAYFLERVVPRAVRAGGAGVGRLRGWGAFGSAGFAGPVRPGHGRMIWGETGRPGYGLYDRALGVMYLQGLWEALERSER